MTEAAATPTRIDKLILEKVEPAPEPTQLDRIEAMLVVLLRHLGAGPDSTPFPPPAPLILARPSRIR